MYITIPFALITGSSYTDSEFVWGNFVLAFALSGTFIPRNIIGSEGNFMIYPERLANVSESGCTVRKDGFLLMCRV